MSEDVTMVPAVEADADYHAGAGTSGIAAAGIAVVGVPVAMGIVRGGASTGNQAVDAAVRAVENSSGLPAQEQIAAYEAAHRTLREVLSSIEE